MERHTREKLLLAALAASLAAALAGAILLAEARAAEAAGEPAKGRAVLEAAPTARLRPSMLFGGNATVKPVSGAEARAPAALLEELRLETRLRLPLGARVLNHTVTVAVDVDGYPLRLAEHRGEGPPPASLRLDPALAQQAAAAAAEEAGLQPPRATRLTVTVEATVETPLETRTLKAAATVSIEGSLLKLKASRAEAVLATAPPTPQEPPLPAKTALVLLAAGAAASLAAAAGYAATRSRPILPPDATVEGTLEPNGRPLAILENPEALADIAAEAGEPIVLDHRNSRACVATRSAVYCAPLPPEAGDGNKG